MKFFTTSVRLVLFASCLVNIALTGCVGFDPAVQSTVESLDERPSIAILPFGFDVEITQLSAVKTVEETLLPEDEAPRVIEALREVQREARWLLLSRLATGYGFQFVSLEQTDALADELQLHAGALPTAEQLTEFRRRLGADLVISGSILDYGKIRWQWLAAGMFADISWETIAIGVATAWNPGVILGNVGYELLPSTPLWFGGGYLFGVAMRPVRVEARAFETVQGYPIWQAMDESAYAWGALKTLPEEIRGKKEVQLLLNLAEIMESLGDDLTKQAFIAFHLREPSAPAGRP